MSALDRVPTPTVARERVLALLSDVLPDDEAAALARALGDEVRDALQQEHEDDLDRARVRSFDFGARTVLRSLVQAGKIPEADEEPIAGRFAAGPTIEWPRLRDELTEYVMEMPPEWLQISDVEVPWTPETAGRVADEIVEIVRRLVP